MNKIALLSTLSLALLTSFGAQAADTTELKVKGVIRPSACTPSFTGGGVVDYGTIPAKSLNATAPTALAEKSLSFTITCDGNTKVGFAAVDNRRASVVAGLVGAAATYNAIGDTGAFGLGTVQGTKIGVYTLRIDPTSVAADGTTPDSIYDQSGTWKKSTNGLFGASGDYKKSFATTGSLTPTAYKTISGTVSVQAIIDKASNLPLNQDIPLDGSATIEVQYL